MKNGKLIRQNVYRTELERWLGRAHQMRLMNSTSFYDT